MTQETKIAGQNAVVYTPDNYDKSKKYPAIVFYTGLGEKGTSISKLYIHGPAKFLKDGTLKPDCIVVCLQHLTGWVKPETYEKSLQEINTKYSVSYFSLTGLSAGASAIFNYLAFRTTDLPIYSVVPMSYFPTAEQALTGKYKDIKVWAFSGTVGESFYNALNGFITKLKAAGVDAKITTYPQGHTGWNQFYDPKFKEGVSIYDFMTGKKEAQPSPVPDPPPPTRKLIATVKVFEDGSIEKS